MRAINGTISDLITKYLSLNAIQTVISVNTIPILYTQTRYIAQNAKILDELQHQMDYALVITVLLMNLSYVIHLTLMENVARQIAWISTLDTTKTLKGPILENIDALDPAACFTDAGMGSSPVMRSVMTETD